MATTLAAGDVAFLSLIADNPDTFSFVVLKDIEAGTIINVTDNGWSASGAFRTGEGVLQYVAPTAQAAGTVVTYIDGSTNTGWTNISGGTFFALSTSGDSLIAFQGLLTGTGGTTTSTSPILLAAVTINRSTFDADAINSNTTALPTGLTVGVNAVAVGKATVEYDDSRYTGSTTFASASAARTAINTASNWTGSDTDTTNFSGTFTIGAANPAVNLSVSTNTGSEAGQTVITVTATASSAVSGDQTVNLGVTGTGITAGDYTLSNTAITIPNGATSGSITFTVVDDTQFEGTETAILTISSPSAGITLGGTTSQNITIADNDLAPTPSVNLSVSATTGSEAGTTAITLTATASSSVTGDQTVNLNVGGTNITAGDYTLSDSVITIPNGATSGSVTFTIVDDTLIEGTEIASLSLSNPSAGIALGNTTNQSISIVDNDGNASLVTTLTISGSATDLYPTNGGSGGANINRLGGFGSDFFYDYRTGSYYGLADRGPGGGTIPYQTRVEKIALTVDPTSGAASGFQVVQTIAFYIPAGTTLNGVTYIADTPFNGLNSKLLADGGNGSLLAESQDPEGFVVGANGNFFVSDEYGPSIYEFDPTGKFIRALTPPANVLPKVNGVPYYAGDVSSTTGRQDNRGYEGLAISPDGTKLFAVFQDPLQEEGLGGSNPGRNSRNVRIVRYDVATGQSEAQFIYQLESLSDINDRIPGTTNDFSATAQGRNIGVSSLTAINNNELLVLERDNRGIGVDSASNLPIGSKRVYKIDLTGATDVSGISLVGTNALPANVTPVGKSLFLDIASAIQGAGQTIPEKIEGLAIGPQLADGSFALLVATDNDFSVTQNGSGTQLDVYTDGTQQAIDSAPPASGVTLLPSYVYSFKTQAGALNVTPIFDFSTGNYSVVEGNTPGFSTNATVRVTRRGDLTRTDTVQLQLSDGTATGGSATPPADYNNAPIAVTFNPGESFKDVQIPVAGDFTLESDETVNLRLVNSSAGTVIGTKQPNAILTIANDDVPPSAYIHDIQGAAHRSPLESQTVTNVPGIVTAVASNGFYLQDPNPDNDDRTSEGIFVFTSSAPTVAIGDSVQVSGKVSEFRPGNNANNLTTTEIISPTINKISSGNALPAAIVLGNGGRTIPNTVIENDATNVESNGLFDPAQDGIDFYESLEGMLVQINNPVATSRTNDFGEVWVLADNGANATSRTARGGSLINATDFNPERIQIDDSLVSGGTPKVSVGAQLGTIVGVVDYNFNSYEVLPTTAPTVITPSALTREVTNLAATTNQLTVATFNVQNLDIGDGATKFSNLADRIVNNLKSPDIIVVEEMQDNNGPTNNGVVDASTTYQTLINAIAAAGGPTYQYRQIDPVNNQDGGEPGGNIRQGFLFNPNRTQFVDRPGGGSTTNTTVTNVNGVPTLSTSPGRVVDTNPGEADTFPGDDFASSRKPLVGEFTFNGQTVFVVGNHFNSKGGDQPLYGPNQPPTLSSANQRIQQATQVKNFVQSILAIDPNANVVVAGDLNDFEFSNPLNILKSGGLSALIETLPANERYTYNFEGNAQTLDHILASNSLLGKLDGFDVVHINSEFSDQVSDHDPSVARFNLAPLNIPPVATSDTAATNEDTSVSINVLTNDIDTNGDVLQITAIATTPGNGTAVINDNGTPSNFADDFIVYTPNANYNGSDSFAYTISDGKGGTATAAVSLTINPVNDPATIAGTATATVTEDTTVDGNGKLTAIGALTITDVDTGESKFNTTVTSANSNLGSLSVTEAGAFSYSVSNSAVQYLGAGQTKTETFTVKSLDGTASQDITVTIAGVNDTPVISIAVTATKTEDDALFTVNLLANATDVDISDTLNVANFTLVSGNAAGVTVNGNSLSINPNAYNSLAVGQTNAIQYSYSVSDGKGGNASQSATITIQGLNDAPLSVVDNVTTTEKSSITFNVLTNDSDPDTGDRISLTGFNFSGLKGTASFSSNGSITYNPGIVFKSMGAGQSAIDSLTYTITDTQGASSTGTANITVTGLNDAPGLNLNLVQNLSAILEDPTTNNGVQVLTFTGSAITDPDANALKGIAVTKTVGNGWQYSTDSGTNWTGFGSVSNTTALLLSADTLVRYNPALNFNGDVNLTYRAWDQASGTVGGKVSTSTNGGATAFSTQTATSSLTVQAVDDAPVNKLPASASVTQGSSLTFASSISVSDVDAGNDPIKVTIGVNKGGFSLSGVSGLSFSEGDGLDDTSMTFMGTLTAINTALKGSKYTPDFPAVFQGSATLTITSDDLGNNGQILGATSTTNTLSIMVNKGKVINGTTANNTLNGTSGADFISGLAGNDVLYGNGGSDILLGGDGNDTIYVGAGSAWIDGGLGNDTIYLGGGNDTIVLARGNGTDTVYNYPAGSTRFNLSAGLTFNDLTIAQDGNNTLISAGTERLASLVGVQASSLTASRF